MALSGKVFFMNPFATHQLICRSMSVTSSRPFRSWNGSPSLMISGRAPVYLAVISTTSS